MDFREYFNDVYHVIQLYVLCVFYKFFVSLGVNIVSHCCIYKIYMKISCRNFSELKIDAFKHYLFQVFLLYSLTQYVYQRLPLAVRFIKVYRLFFLFHLDQEHKVFIYLAVYVVLLSKVVYILPMFTETHLSFSLQYGILVQGKQFF